MFRLLIARLLSSALVVAGVVVVVFVLARVVGDPVELMIQPGLSDDEIAELRRSLGTDKPLWQQFVTFVGNVARGDFGISPWQGEPAVLLVMERVPATLALAGAAMALAALIAIVVGAVSALRRGSWIDRGAMSVVLLGQSVPNFWLGLMLILLFATTLSWLPSAGYGSAAHFVLPTVTLAFFFIARLTRLVRSELLEVMSQDYIRTARSKGLPESVVFRRHALRNIAVPIVTVLAVDFGALVGGAVVTETVFAWPGVGRLMIQAIGQRDFPIIQAGAFVLAIGVVLANLLADLAYALLDPRVRVG
ncbi:MAG: ABC transporter permease [Betaproteobacteria bacterium]